MEKLAHEVFIAGVDGQALILFDLLASIQDCFIFIVFADYYYTKANVFNSVVRIDACHVCLSTGHTAPIHTEGTNR